MKPPVAVPTPAPAEKSYRVAETRVSTRQISAHFAAEDMQAFRVLAATQDMDVQKLLAEAIKMTFERHGVPNRTETTSRRRERI